jgi:hypothetical protein
MPFLGIFGKYGINAGAYCAGGFLKKPQKRKSNKKPL